MPVSATLLALGCMTTLAVLLRLCWPRMHARARRWTAVGIVSLLLPALLNLVSRWESTSNRFNASLGWTRIFAYELLLMLFTLLRPRMLTVIVAGILLLPVFSSSVVGPLTGLFNPAQPSTVPIADEYYLQLLPWSSGPAQNSGADFTLFYQPAHSPWLRRPFMGARLYNTQCRTASTFATLRAAQGRIAVHCPALQTNSGATPAGSEKLRPERGLQDAITGGTELEYTIPPGARSNALREARSR